jgi:hypothetical protein
LETFVDGERGGPDDHWRRVREGLPMLTCRATLGEPQLDYVGWRRRGGLAWAGVVTALSAAEALRKLDAFLAAERPVAAAAVVLSRGVSPEALSADARLLEYRDGRRDLREYERWAVGGGASR